MEKLLNSFILLTSPSAPQMSRLDLVEVIFSITKSVQAMAQRRTVGVIFECPPHPVYIMADRYRGTIYVGVTSDLAARIHQHRAGTGSDFCARYALGRLVWAERGDTIEDCIAHEKRIKRRRRQWKFDLIELGNPEWCDLFDVLN